MDMMKNSLSTIDWSMMKSNDNARLSSNAMRSRSPEQAQASNSQLSQSAKTARNGKVADDLVAISMAFVDQFGKLLGGFNCGILRPWVPGKVGVAKLVWLD